MYIEAFNMHCGSAKYWMKSIILNIEFVRLYSTVRRYKTCSVFKMFPWNNLRYVCVVITFSRLGINRAWLRILLVVSWTGNMNPPCRVLRLRVWSCELGSVVPSRVSPLTLHTQAESDACLRDSTLPSPFPPWFPFEASCAIGLVPSLSGHSLPCIDGELRQTLAASIHVEHSPLFAPQHPFLP